MIYNDNYLSRTDYKH